MTMLKDATGWTVESQYCPCFHCSDFVSTSRIFTSPNINNSKERKTIKKYCKTYKYHVTCEKLNIHFETSNKLDGQVKDPRRIIQYV